MNEWWLLLPVLSALIGWLIVKLLVSFFQTWLLGQRRAMMASVSKLLGKELLSFSDIEKIILATGSYKQLIPEVEVHIDHFLTVKLKEKMPMVGMLVGERTLAQLKQIFMEEIEILFPVIMKSYLAGLGKDFDPTKIIAERFESIPDEKFSALLLQMMPKNLKYLPLAGACIGFLISIVNILVILFLYR